MATSKSGTVTGIRGNVVFCDFSADSKTLLNHDTDVRSVLTAVGSAAAEINADAREILGANLATAQLGVDNSNLLFVTLGKIDNIAFHSNAIAANTSYAEGDPCGVGLIAGDVRELVNKGAEATRRLRALVAEQKHVTMAAGSVLREISEQVAHIEAKARARIDPVCAQMREVEAATFTNYAGGIDA
jgi:hypothetical protein